MKKIFTLIVLVMIAASCNKQSGPEGVLSEYINKFLSKRMSKREVLEYLGKDLKKSITEMNDVEYNAYLDKNSFEKRSFRILHQSCTDTKCNITYVVKYRQKTLASGEYNVDVKKIAELQKIDELWKITDIENSKTFIEAKKSIDIR